jgi:hypothetical protein
MLSELLFYHNNGCPIRIQIQFWVHEAAGSNPASPTTSPVRAAIGDRGPDGAVSS